MLNRQWRIGRDRHYENETRLSLDAIHGGGVRIGEVVVARWHGLTRGMATRLGKLEATGADAAAAGRGNTQ